MEYGRWKAENGGGGTEDGARFPSTDSPVLVSAVIPAHNEAARIGETVRQVAEFVDEVIVVDDGSSDGTAEVAQAAGAQVVRQPVNRGYIAAIKRGFAEAKCDVVVTIDADGEFPAEAIPALVAPIERGEADMVQGARSVVPRFSERILNWLANQAAPVGDSGTGLRALRTGLARQLEIRGVCICGVLSLEAASRGARIVNVPVHLESVAKPRRIAWYHLRQFFYLLPWLSSDKGTRGQGDRGIGRQGDGVNDTNDQDAP